MLFKRIILSISLSLTSVAAAPSAACTDGTVTTSNGSICKTTCGLDRPGGDYDHTYTGSFSGCIQACSADSTCLTAQYSSTNGYCYLKNSVNPTRDVAEVDTVDCCPGPSTFGARTCTTTCGIDRPGGDYASLYTGNIKACISACGQDPNCVTAQWKVSNGYCYLKDSTHGAVSTLDVDSVDCS